MRSATTPAFSRHFEGFHEGGAASAAQSGPIVRVFERVQPGPEETLMEALSTGIRSGFFGDLSACWVGRGMTIGPGDPDYLIASHTPALLQFEAIEEPHWWALALLQQVPGCTSARMAEHLGSKQSRAERVLSGLVHLGLVRLSSDGHFSLAESSREPLVEVVAIEAKVSRWKEAVRQAVKNRQFSHRSYVALPWALAAKVSMDPLFQIHHLGLLGIDEVGLVDILLAAPSARPVAWHHYFELASKAARSMLQGDPCLTTRFLSTRPSEDSLNSTSFRL